MGHFNRAYSIAQALKPYPWINPLIFSTSALLSESMGEGISVINWPGYATSAWPRLTTLSIADLIQSLGPDLLVTDTFEHGPENELASFQGTRRILQRDGTQPLSEQHWLVNPNDAGYVLNTFPDALVSRDMAHHFLQVKKTTPVILVVHNGEPVETRSFFERILHVLKDTPYQVRLCSLLPCLRPDWRPIWIRTYPLAPWYKGADLVVGGGGYNLVTEARCYGLRGLFCAFEGPVDQQWQRIQHLPHFHLTDAPEYIRQQIARLLNAPPPRPEPHSSGAVQIAQRIVKVIDYNTGHAHR